MGARRLLPLATFLMALVACSPARAADATADYLVQFHATWSQTSHPVDFPVNAHFSRLVGGTHDGSVSFWQAGQIATEGIERMAELGNPSQLADEIAAQIPGGADQVMVAEIGSASPGTSIALSFTASATHPYLTLVTMVAPSPDWFVGVSAHPLLVDGEWTELEVVELFAWDAGTDDGITYTSPDADTQPPDPIAPIMAPPAYSGVKLGTYTIVRTDVPEGVPALGALATGVLAAVLLVAGALGVPRGLRPRGRTARGWPPSPG